MEYTLDAIISFTLFALTLATFLTLMVDTVVLAFNELISPINLYSTVTFPTSLEIVIVRGGYVIRSSKRCLITYVIVEPEGKCYVSYGITPLKVITKSSNWVIAFTYTSVSVKMGTPIKSKITISMYGIVTKRPIPPYVIIEGSNYEIVPNFSKPSNIMSIKNFTYSIYNNTVVLRVRK